MTVKSKRTRCEFLGKPGANVKVEGNYVINNINVQSGCTVYFTPDGGIQEKQQEGLEATPETTPLRDVPLSRFEQAIQAGIRAVLNAGLIQYKQDFRAIHQIMVEMSVYDNFSLSSFIKLVSNLPEVPPQLLPTMNSIKKISFGKDSFPNWRIRGMSVGNISRMVEIAHLFKRIFNAMLTNHVQDR